MRKRRVLLLAADRRLNSSLADLLRLDDIDVKLPDARGEHTTPQVDLVIAACDSWPRPWSIELARRRFRNVPTLLLSGSPVSGPYAAAGFRKGYFLGLPASARGIAATVTSLVP